VNTNTAWIPPGTPSDWRFSSTTSGWTNDSLGYEWLSTLFDPETRREDGRTAASYTRRTRVAFNKPLSSVLFLGIYRRRYSSAAFVASTTTARCRRLRSAKAGSCGEDRYPYPPRYRPYIASRLDYGLYTGWRASYYIAEYTIGLSNNRSSTAKPDNRPFDPRDARQPRYSLPREPPRR